MPHREIGQMVPSPEQRVREPMGDLREALANLEAAGALIRRVAEGATQALVRAIGQWDHGTGTHIERTSRYAAVIARGAGFDRERTELIRVATQLHDIGKVGLPEQILFKRGRLSPAEFDVIKTHAERGADILGLDNVGVLGTAAVIARTHHEWWDGGGYPNGLAGRQIPIEGRIAAVADVFDALVSRRVYKPAYPIEEALDALRQGRGTRFHGELVDIFVASMAEVGEIQRRYPDEYDPALERARRAVRFVAVAAAPR